ncbi:MAG: TadE/TadG family type IV pilus assembly protein, partial [Bryobacteraceae bacterium]
MNLRKSSGERGSAVIEFVMIALFCVPLLLGTATVGLDLIREMEVTQLTRDAARMYSDGIDFMQSSNQTLLANLSPDLGLSTGNAVVIFSTLTYVDPDCYCTNAGKTVFVKRVVVGNASLYTSTFGAPLPSELDGEGNVTDYQSNSSA